MTTFGDGILNALQRPTNLYTLADVSAGDRVTLEHDDGSKLVREVSVTFNDESVVAITEGVNRKITALIGHEGWRITAVEKPEPEVELPTEPGYYIDDEGDAWLVPQGSETLVVLSPDSKNVRLWAESLTAADYAPFTRLAPVPETAKKVLDALCALLNDDKFSVEKAINKVAAEFGASND